MSGFIFPANPSPRATLTKVCDLIADSVLDGHLAQDPRARVARQVLCKGNQVVVAGEITSGAAVDIEVVVRETVAGIGYTDPAAAFSASRLQVMTLLTQQAPEIAHGVGAAADAVGDLGAGIARLAYTCTVHCEVTSIRARRDGRRILYRVVDEYDSPVELSRESSEQALAMHELIALIDETCIRGSRPGLYLGDLAWRVDNEEDAAEDLAGFIEVSSPFYPQLGEWYEAAFQRWCTAMAEADGDASNGSLELMSDSGVTKLSGRTRKAEEGDDSCP